MWILAAEYLAVDLAAEYFINMWSDRTSSQQFRLKSDTAE